MSDAGTRLRGRRRRAPPGGAGCTTQLTAPTHSPLAPARRIAALLSCPRPHRDPPKIPTARRSFARTVVRVGFFISSQGAKPGTAVCCNDASFARIQSRSLRGRARLLRRRQSASKGDCWAPQTGPRSATLRVFAGHRRPVPDLRSQRELTLQHDETNPSRTYGQQPRGGRSGLCRRDSCCGGPVPTSATLSAPEHYPTTSSHSRCVASTLAFHKPHTERMLATRRLCRFESFSR